jgi:hypothetical protein
VKRSEFMRLMKEEIGAEGFLSNGVIERLLDARKRGAEAAGVVWDPEEEPKKIVAARSEMGWLPMMCLGPVEHRFLSEKEAGEVVRRYNAWPELELLATDYDTPATMRLRMILRGGH